MSSDNPFLLPFGGSTDVVTVARLISTHLLGDDQYPKICLRYADMRDNFDCLTYDEWTKTGSSAIWRFSSGVTPYRDYDDTSSVPIPISNPIVKAISDNAVTSLDLPVWFVPEVINHKVMILSQDPMPRSDWYDDCRDAVCSTPFGLHSKSWREKGNGGGRMWSLVQQLITFNIGVYLTDIRKFYFRTANSRTYIPATSSILNSYRALLTEEIKLYAPDLIISMGNQAACALNELADSEHDVPLLRLPHFSGQAQGKIKTFFEVSDDSAFDINSQSKLYLDAILNKLNNK